jgi:hypothetical protein
MTRETKTAALAAWALTALMTLGACTKSNPAGPEPPLPPAVSQASISVAISNPAYGTSSRAGFNYELQFGVRVTESAGLAASLNFIRLELYDPAGALIERQEIGSSIFSGGNRLNASSSRDFNVLMGFNAEPRSGRFVRIGVGTTDDRNNTQVAISDRLFF